MLVNLFDEFKCIGISFLLNICLWLDTTWFLVKLVVLLSISMSKRIPSSLSRRSRNWVGLSPLTALSPNLASIPSETDGLRPNGSTPFCSSILRVLWEEGEPGRSLMEERTHGRCDRFKYSLHWQRASCCSSSILKNLPIQCKHASCNYHTHTSNLDTWEGNEHNVHWRDVYARVAGCSQGGKWF